MPLPDSAPRRRFTTETPAPGGGRKLLISMTENPIDPTVRRGPAGRRWGLELTAKDGERVAFLVALVEVDGDPDLVDFIMDGIAASWDRK